MLLGGGGEGVGEGVILKFLVFGPQSITIGENSFLSQSIW